MLVVSAHNICFLHQVIVREVVLRSIIVQFRAHRSPIAALCFDPSGTLLVTASVSGHNINVFRIMPSPHGCSTGSDATGTSIHLYRLQRGITNVVIQDISFSGDSQWVMISSSRGTSQFFEIPPSGGSANLQFGDANFAYDGSGPDASPNLTSLSLSPSGSPITLSVVGRIRNRNGWKGAVTGAVTAATGRVSPLNGATFHNCKGPGLYTDCISSVTKQHLLVFSPSGCIIQYVLRQSTLEESGVDSSWLSAVSSGFSQESDPSLVVEALQKWDICHKRNRRDQVDCVDVKDEHGNAESTKPFQKEREKSLVSIPPKTKT